jgi:transcriptional regulator NrdR family protein
MSSSHPKGAPIFEPLPCPECGQIEMTRTIETCRLGDGLIVKRIRHYKCRSCGARFFDDDAVRDIQSIRASAAASKSVC